MKLQSDSDTPYQEAYIYRITWRDIHDGQISTTYVAHTNTLADLSAVAAQIEQLHQDMILNAIQEVGLGYILTDPDPPKEPKPK